MSARTLTLALVVGCLVCFCPGRAAAVPVSTNAPASISLPEDMPPRMRERVAKLSPAEQRKFLERWEQLRNLSPEARKLLNRNYQKFIHMPPEQREELKQRLQQWQSMTPEEKRRVQENFQRWKQLSPQEREEVRKRHNRAPPAPTDTASGDSPAPAAKAVPAAAQSP